MTVAERTDQLLQVMEVKKEKPETYFGLKMAVDLFTALKTSPLGRRKIKSLKGISDKFDHVVKLCPLPE